MITVSLRFIVHRAVESKEEKSRGNFLDSRTIRIFNKQEQHKHLKSEDPVTGGSKWNDTLW